MRNIYRDCILDVEEYEEGAFAILIEDKATNNILMETTLKSDEECEESILDKLKVVVDEYKVEPEEFLEYSYPSNREQGR